MHAVPVDDAGNVAKLVHEDILLVKIGMYKAEDFLRALRPVQAAGCAVT